MEEESFTWELEQAEGITLFQFPARFTLLTLLSFL